MSDVSLPLRQLGADHATWDSLFGGQQFHIRDYC